MATKTARKRKSRAGEAGRNMALSIIESVHLLYQKNTALNYLRELIRVLRIELNSREGNSKAKKTCWKCEHSQVWCKGYYRMDPDKPTCPADFNFMIQKNHNEKDGEEVVLDTVQQTTLLRVLIHAVRVARQPCEDPEYMSVLKIGPKGPKFRCGKCRSCRGKNALQELAELEKKGASE